MIIKRFAFIIYRVFNNVLNFFKKKKAFKYNPNAIHRYLTIEIENTSNGNFGFDLFSMSNLNLPDFIKIRCQECPDFFDFLMSIKMLGKGSWIDGFSVIAGSDAMYLNGSPVASEYDKKIHPQLRSSLGFSTRFFGGHIYSRYVHLENYYRLDQDQSNRVDVTAFKFDINHETRIGIQILPFTKICLLLKVVSIDVMISEGGISYHEHEFYKKNFEYKKQS